MLLLKQSRRRQRPLPKKWCDHLPTDHRPAMTFPVTITNRCPDIPLPSRGTALSAGFDLRAAVDEPVTLQPGQRKLIPSGISIAIPGGYEGQVRPRSGLALKHGIAMVNAPGTIDADYRGEIGMILINLGDQPFRIERGDRVAQLVIAAIADCEFVLSETLDGTDRGAGGFGSTGL